MSAEATLYRIHCILQARAPTCCVQPSHTKTSRGDEDDDPSDREKKRQATPQDLQQELAMLRQERDQLEKDKTELEQQKASLEAIVTAIKTELESDKCGICLETLRDPASLLCGHNYCSECVDDYVHDKQQPHPVFGLLPINCPTCRVEFQHKDVRPNLVLGRIANRFVEAADGQEHTEHAEDGVYTGQMFRGQREGPGVLVGKDGSRYEGEFKNGKPHGHGEKTYANGDKYVGQWKKGSMEGKGVYTWETGSTYDGEWKNDKRHGRGVFKKVGCYEYEGQFADGMRNGQGVMKIGNGDQYVGQWQGDNREGRGVYTWKNGATYDGEWKHDKRHGIGVHKKGNGNIYEGEWKNGKRHGQGTLTDSEGTRRKGQWRDNKILPKAGDRVYFENVDLDSEEIHFDITVPYILWGTVLEVFEHGDETNLNVKLDDRDENYVSSHLSFVYDTNAVDPGPPEPGPKDLRNFDRVMVVGIDIENLNGKTGYVQRFNSEYGNWQITLDDKRIEKRIVQYNELTTMFDDIRIHVDRLRRAAPSTNRVGPGFAAGDRVQLKQDFFFSEIDVEAPHPLRGTVLESEDEHGDLFIKFDDSDQPWEISEKYLTRAHADDPGPPEPGPRDLKKNDRVIVVGTGGDVDGNTGYVEDFDKKRGIFYIIPDHDPDELEGYHVNRLLRANPGGARFAVGDRVQVKKYIDLNRMPYIDVDAPDPLRGTVLEVEEVGDDIYGVLIKFDDSDRPLRVLEENVLRAAADDPGPPEPGPKDLQQNERVIVVGTGAESVDGTTGYVQDFDNELGIWSIRTDTDPGVDLERYHVNRLRRLFWRR